MLSLLIRDGNKCVYCQKRFTTREDITFDHVLPKKLGGTLAQTNLVLSCKKCNSYKSDMLLTEFIKKYNIKVTRTLERFL